MKSEPTQEREMSRLERVTHQLAMIEERWKRGDGLDGERGLELIGQIIEMTGLMAEEMTRVRATFTATPVKRRDEEEERAQQALMDQTQMLTLIDVIDDEDLVPSKADRDLARHLRDIVDDEDAAVCLRKEFVAEGTRVIRAMIAFIWQRAPNEKAMVKRMTAITRRYQREVLAGITQTSVARLHNEKSRCAAASARERDVHDEQFERVGVRAPGAADRGLKTESTKKKSKKAALGNSNRKGKGNQTNQTSL